MRTDDFIRDLVKEAVPVRRLASPARRVILWMLVSFAYSGAIVYAMGMRPDLWLKVGELKFSVEVVAALATALLAALAAFSASQPGRPVWHRFAPLPPLAIWLSTLGAGCWQQFMQFGPEGLHLTPDLFCFPAIVLVGTVPAVLIIWMLRKGAPVAPLATSALAALAAAALGAAALRLFHPQDASIMVLVWQLGTVALLTALGALGGRRLFRWPERRFSPA